MEQIKNKKKSIILFNLPESITNDDAGQVGNLLREEFNLNVEGLETKRMGPRREDKIRLLRVELPSVQEKKNHLIESQRTTEQ